MIAITEPQISEEGIKEVIKVLKSGHLASGEKVNEFEKRFAEYIGSKYAVAASSGTMALYASLLSLKLNVGDNVITTPFSFIASSNCILFVGANPVFVDINPKTYNIATEKIRNKITDKTRSLLVVHLFGQPCQMDSILDLCEDKCLFLIEDACQAHGAEYRGKKVGSFGDIACFSFYATKNMITGEGGMITTNNEELANKAKMLDQGQKRKYYHTELGFNFRMTEIQAAIGIEQLKSLERRNEKRINNAKFLTKNLSGIDGIIPPYVSKNVKHVFHQYVIRSPYRKKLRTFLSAKGSK